MKQHNLRLLWDDTAKAELKKELTYIRKESAQGAEAVKRKILETAKLLPDNPYAFEEDSLKLNNDGSYRRFNALGYRIVYKITDSAIWILRIRHTSREPLEY